jgi:hypothetical protein
MGLTVEDAPAPVLNSSSTDGEKVKDDAEEAGYTMREALGTTSFWLIFSATFFVMFSASGFSLHVVAFLSDEGLASRSATLIWSISLSVSIVGRFVFGFLSEHCQKRYLASAGNISRFFSLLILVFFALKLVPQAAALGQFVILYGLGQGCNAVMAPLIIGETYGVKAFGKLMGLLGIPYTIGMALGQIAGGRLYVLHDNYELAFTVFGFAFLVAGIAIVLARPYFLLETSSPANES